MILAGDIGGTKTNLALFSPERGPHEPQVEATFPSGRYGSLEEIITAFLADHPTSLTAACFGVAGPVVQGVVDVTNLPWVIAETTISARFTIPTVRLLNDLEALAQAVPILEPGDVATLNVGKAVPQGAIAVIAPGTGLGEAFLTWDGRRYRANPSEGGHTSFAPVNEEQLELWRYLSARLGHISYERVCSGIGMPNIYAYARDVLIGRETPAIAARLAQGGDPTPVIVGGALDPSDPCPVCAASLRIFIDVLGAEAGNLALKVLATGGIYLGGGIPPRIIDRLREPRFLEALREKGRFGDLLEPMPVHVILNPKAALLGAASYALL